MSTLAKSQKKQKIRHSILTYAAWALFCGLFSFIYEQFSHGVYSQSMIWMFLFPLIGGVLLFSLIRWSKALPFPGRVSYNLHNSAIATFTVGSCFAGILEIYGTTSSLQFIYWLVGSMLAVGAWTLYLRSILQKARFISDTGDKV